MPLYAYECKKCGIRTEIVRSIRESDSLPEASEVKPKENSCPHAEHDWQKLIGGNITLLATGAWVRHGGKGNW